MAPLKVALGVEPRNPLSTTLPAMEVSSEREKTAKDILEQTKAVQDLARQNTLTAQTAMEIQANKRRRKVDFNVGDFVYISKKGFTTEAPTTRLDAQ